MPGKIIERNISVEVAGKKFNNVIHTQVNLWYDLPMYGKCTLAIYDYYIANNIGIVLINTDVFDLFGNKTSTTKSELIEYSIK